MPFWVCQEQPLPEIQFRIIFFVLDIILLFFIIGVYNLSKFKIQNLKNLFNPDIEYSLYIDSALNLSLVGMILIIINNFLSHSFVLFFPQYGAYLFVGFTALIEIIGISMHILGLTVFNFRLLNQIRDFKETNQLNVLYFITIVVYVILLSLIITTIPILQRSILSNILLVAALIYLFLQIYYLVFSIEYKSNIIRLRIYLFLTLNALLVLIIFLGLFFLPNSETPPDQWLTRNQEVEMLLLLNSLFAISSGVVIYLLVKLPKWFVSMVSIDEEEYMEYIRMNSRLDSERTVNLSLDTSDFSQNPGLMTLLDQGFLCFSNLQESELQDYTLLNSIKNGFEIISDFKVEDTRDQFFNNKINTSSNLLFVVDEIDENLDYLIDEIYRIYLWDINIHNDKISLNNYVFTSPDWSVTLIFSGHSVWHDDFWSYLFLVPDELKIVFSDFVDNYKGYIESLSQFGPYVLIIFFPKDSDGKYLNIPGDKEIENFPEGDYVRVFYKDKEFEEEDKFP